MRRGRLPRRVRVEARGKLNLFLAVGPRRADGFHDLATVFQSVSLADTLLARRSRAGCSLAVRFEDASVSGTPPATRRVPMGRGSLVLRAARLAADRLGIPGGIRFTLIKRIPVQSGLGGGSADAAAAIVATAALHARRVPLATRLEWAAELGSDVPFAMLGGTALGAGRGERLERARLSRPFRAVVAMPRWRVSTARAFARIDRSRNRLTRWSPRLRSLQLFGRKQLSPAPVMRLGNSFEQVLDDRSSAFVALCERLRAAGAEEVRMTGSGSAVFGVLGTGASATDVVGRFTGNEALYVVRSKGRGLRVVTLP